ncbi:MAG: NifB/NifX family molybdenum-iron cluster-binding protein [Pseudomonadota bacterium]
MRVAIPLFQGRVSPYFGSSDEVFIAEIQGGSWEEEVYPLKAQTPMELAWELLGFGAEVVICGGIQNYCKKWLLQKGIRIVENQKGEIKTLIRSLLEKRNLKKRGGQHGK